MAPGGARRAHVRGPARRDTGDLSRGTANPPGAAAPRPPAASRGAPAGEVVLFDLDGVLADSRVAITSCMNRALEAAGREPVPPEALYPLIGPPLPHGFATLLGADAGDPSVADCVASYRAIYGEVSLRDTPAYPGVHEALEAIAGRGAGAHGGPAADGGPRDGSPPPRLAVATSKPRPFAEPLIAALGLRGFFEAVFAPELDLEIESKTTTVARALDALGASTGTMVGDRHVDMEAARAHGLRGVGVTWGFGTAEELRRAGAHVLVASPADLPAAVGPIRVPRART